MRRASANPLSGSGTADSSATFKFSIPGYDRIDTTFGKILVKVERMEPYRDGLKVHFSVRQPVMIA